MRHPARRLGLGGWRSALVLGLLGTVVALIGLAAGQCDCEDVVPIGSPYTCAQQKSYGACNDSFIQGGGFCQKTCGACQCTASGEAVEEPNGSAETEAASPDDTGSSAGGVASPVSATSPDTGSSVGGVGSPVSATSPDTVTSAGGVGSPVSATSPDTVTSAGPATTPAAVGSPDAGISAEQATTSMARRLREAIETLRAIGDVGRQLADDSCTCTDVPPADSNYTCAEQRAFGACTQSWMAANGYCQRTCGTCKCPGATSAAPAAPDAGSPSAPPPTLSSAPGPAAPSDSGAPAPAPAPMDTSSSQASDSGTPCDPSSLMDVLQSNANLSTLVKALQAADIASSLPTGPKVVLAPTDSAFNFLLQQLPTTLDALTTDKKALTNLLEFHVIPNTTLDQALSKPQVPTLLPGMTLSLAKSNSTLLVVGPYNTSIVRASKTLCDGTTVLLLDDVMLPGQSLGEFETAGMPGAAPQAPCNSTLTAKQAVAALGPDYSIFNQALNRTKVLDRIDRPGISVTILAPNNEAFQRYLSSHGYQDVDSVPFSELLDVVRYLIIPGAVMHANQFQSGSSLVTLAGSSIMPSAFSKGVSFDGIGSSAILNAPDLAQGCSVEIQGIDNVLLPNKPTVSGSIVTVGAPPPPPPAPVSAPAPAAAAPSGSGQGAPSGPSSDIDATTVLPAQATEAPIPSGCRTLESLLNFAPDLSMFSTALRYAGTDVNGPFFNPKSPVTIFAPTNDAYNTLFFIFNQTTPELGTPFQFYTNTTALNLFMRYLVVPGTYKAADLENNQQLPTMAVGADGKPLNLTAIRTPLTPQLTRLTIDSIGGVPAQLVQGETDISTCNATVQVVDQVPSPIPLDTSVLEKNALEQAVQAGRLPPSALGRVGSTVPGLSGLPGPGALTPGGAASSPAGLGVKPAAALPEATPVAPPAQAPEPAEGAVAGTTPTTPPAEPVPAATPVTTPAVTPATPAASPAETPVGTPGTMPVTTPVGTAVTPAATPVVTPAAATPAATPAVTPAVTPAATPAPAAPPSP